MKKVSGLLSIVALCGMFAMAGCSSSSSSGGNSPASSSSKEITSFEIISPVTAVGVIDESAKTINITVPYNTDVTKLIVKFETTGVKTTVSGVEQISSNSSVDFLKPVTYIVTAQDGSIKAYIATVTIAAPVASLPAANPAGSAVHTGSSVTLTSTAGSTIYYTLDGNNPTSASSSIASGSAITVNPPVTLKAYAVLGTATSGIMTENYTLLPNGTVAAPVVSVTSGLVASGTSVSLTCATAGADIYYTLDNTTPSLINGTKYTASITVAENTTILAIAVKYGMTNSALLTAAYTVKVDKPVITPGSGTVVSGTGVSISCVTSGAVIYYTTDGNDPTTSSNIYSTPVSVTAEIKAMAVKANMVNSDIAEVSYTVLSANANLSSLVLSAGTLSPTFASGTTSYTASVDNAVSSITVTPTLTDATASVTVNNVTVASGTASGAIALTVGTNTIAVTVTSQGGAVKTYTVCIKRLCETTTISLPGGSNVNLITTPTVAQVTAGVTPQFPTGTDDSVYVNVPDPFIMAETDVTYQLWKEVYDWATNSARGTAVYSFANPGQNGADFTNSGLISIGINTTISTLYPVTNVNWRDAIVWCNAFTEYYNANNGIGTDLLVVYCTDSGYGTPIRTTTNSTTITYLANGTQDAPYVNASAKGFRLPTSVEYEFAARYIGSSTTNTNVVYKDGVYYTNGASASGATETATITFNNATPTGLVAVYGVIATAVVKSKTSGANALGLYDMSGNVLKWNFDWCPGETGSYRVKRGGSFNDCEYNLRIGWVYWVDPDDNAIGLPYCGSYYIGFRVSRTK